MKWQEIKLKTPDGQIKDAIAPLVISASRATDIPKFHTKWFINRVRAGYCVWKNPFNASQSQYISFLNCKAFVFWSKNPAPLIPHLKELDERGYVYYFQFTLNDYEKEGLEPGLPELRRRLATFQKLADKIGKDRVIWRFDPVILGAGLTVANILGRIQYLAEQLAPWTSKLVFSFLDMYKKTECNLKKLNPDLRAPSPEECQEFAKGLVEINNSLPTPLALATCAEALDLKALGIGHNKCIDPEMLMRICPSGGELARALIKKPAQGALVANAPLKDSGQRAACGCSPSKDIGRYNTCMHLCAYCYANQSKNVVIKEMNAKDDNGEAL